MLVNQDPLNTTDHPTGCVATIGNFDGLHKGHQTIIQTVVDRAAELGSPAVVITFYPHPLAIVAPDRVPPQILTLSQKEELLAEMGIDAILEIPFNQEFSRWSADRFVNEILHEKLKVREVHIGEDFAFGAGRTGDLDFLKEKGKELGFDVEGVPPVTIRGIRVSSSIVRDAIEKGAMRIVQTCLGRDHFVDGRVETGRRLGRKIGVPTVNLAPANELFPRSGVFVTTSHFESFGRTFAGVTNIGVRPTLYENYATTIETHILDFNANVYGDQVRLHFHQLLRREQRFASAVELTNQIQKDIERTRLYFLQKGELPIEI
ncbi:MAG: bifunctional riboflavin kinase/FAD synthetase [Thermoanaerobaculia bacterium]|nr:bifunctional riboflavin kinase/FAD synthetase [Thermoanaerobaculia bacterium]